MALGLIFMVFVGLEAGSKIDDFSGFPGGTPELRERTSRVLKYPFWGAGKQHSYRYHPAVLQGNASQPGGPKGPADFRLINITFG